MTQRNGVRAGMGWVAVNDRLAVSAPVRVCTSKELFEMCFYFF